MKIIVNGKHIDLQTEPYRQYQVAYESVVMWAGHPMHSLLTVTWSMANCQGTLTPGQRIIVKEGIVFNAIDTSNA